MFIAGNDRGALFDIKKKSTNKMKNQYLICIFKVGELAGEIPSILNTEYTKFNFLHATRLIYADFKKLSIHAAQQLKYRNQNNLVQKLENNLFSILFFVFANAPQQR